MGAMSTKVLRPDELEQAAELLAQGQVVAFPTETVYGLGANALDRQAVARIFAAKGRPQDNPLIVHCTGVEQVEKLVREIPEEARLLMERFWPGPLTLVLEKTEAVPEQVTAGLDTVAVRVPDHPVALALFAAGALSSGRTQRQPVWAAQPHQGRTCPPGSGGRIPAVVDGEQRAGEWNQPFWTVRRVPSGCSGQAE